MTENDAETLTPFSKLIVALQAQDGHFSIALPDDWLQGRTAYGGLSAALSLEATQRSFPDLPPLRSAQFSFVGPATGVLRVTTTMLRQGKSTVFTGADLAGENGIAARATLCFGLERSSAHNYAAVPMPQAPPWDDCPGYFTWQNRPNFMRHFEGRLAAGAHPLTPNASPEMLVWLRHRDQEQDAGLVSLFALADALPPAALVLFREPPPISTVTWSIDMLDAEPTNTTGWWLVQYVAETARLGYSAQRAVIWTPDGRPILVARQNVAIWG